MIKVLRHGNKISPVDPLTGKTTSLQNVVFVEYGRKSKEDTMGNTSDYLDGLVNEKTGLGTQRIHTHPIRIEHIGLFPIGKDFPGHINRTLTSVPDIKQQGGQRATMINGRPTFTTTSIDASPMDDRDERLSNEDLIKVNPLAFEQARLGTAQVKVDEVYDSLAATPQQLESSRTSVSQ